MWVRAEVSLKVNGVVYCRASAGSCCCGCDRRCLVVVTAVNAAGMGSVFSAGQGSAV